MADAVRETINDASTRRQFYRGLKGTSPFNASSASGSLQFAMLGQGGYGKVWKVQFKVNNAHELGDDEDKRWDNHQTRNEDARVTTKRGCTTRQSIV